MRMDVWIEGCDRPVGVLTRDDTRALRFVYTEGVRREHQLLLR